MQDLVRNGLHFGDHLSPADIILVDPPSITALKSEGTMPISSRSREYNTCGSTWTWRI
ncbi:hypothetical protein [Desulfonema ishimotonii]|uniref:hypothetical protein n=1 Tax=Desulfonema ishimotonii TaxID=45657 RepID=UPI0014090FB8|nr:hypothetical protein [Desulfonema ishimotonii]